jgi:hypothetical protein
MEEEDELFSSPETVDKIKKENDFYKERTKNIHGSPSKNKTKRIHLEFKNQHGKRKLNLFKEKEEESEQEYIFPSTSQNSSLTPTPPPPPHKKRKELSDFIVPDDVEISQESWTTHSNTPSSSSGGGESSSLEDDVPVLSKPSTFHSPSPQSPHSPQSPSPSPVLSETTLLYKTNPKIHYKPHSTIKFYPYCRFLKRIILGQEESHPPTFEVESDLIQILSMITKEHLEDVEMGSKMEVKESNSSSMCSMCKNAPVEFHLEWSEFYNSKKLWKETILEKYKSKNVKHSLCQECKSSVTLHHQVFHFKIRIMNKIRESTSFRNIYENDYLKMMKQLSDSQL